MLIAALQKISLIDYPGKICSTIFVQGCNFRCPFCYNPGLVDANLYEFNTNFYELKEREVFEYLKKRKGLIEAVCVTGGEPCLQWDLSKFLGKIKKMGFLIKLDTNGSNPEMLKKLIDEKLIDYIAMDIKAPLIWEKYKKAIGISNRKLFNEVLESVEMLLTLSREYLQGRSKIGSFSVAPPRCPHRGGPGEDARAEQRGLKYEFRTTVVPGLLNKKDIIEIAKQIKGAKKYVLQGFVNNKEMIDKKYKNIEPYPKEALEEMVKEAGKYVGKCEIRF